MELFKLKSYLDKYNIQYNIKIINNVVYINDIISNKIDLFIGNKYNFNQSDISNINKNGATNILTNDIIYIKKDLIIT